MDEQKYTEQLGEALLDVPEEKEEELDPLIHLSTGVILSPKKVSPFVIQSITLKFKDPKVPFVYIEDKGRKEYNPMNPDYLAEKEEVEARRSMALIDAVIALGTQLENIPKDFPTPEDDKWLEDLNAAGLEIDGSNERLRYRSWVKFIAAPSVEDVQTLVSKVLSYIGVSEEDVATATANFQHSS